MYRFLSLAAVLLIVVGCQSESQRTIPGAANYNVRGKVVTAPNQVRVINPLDASVRIKWQDGRELVITEHSDHLIAFEGLKKPGPIKAFRLDEKGKEIRELTYTESTEGSPFGGLKVYTLM